MPKPDFSARYAVEEGLCDADAAGRGADGIPDPGPGLQEDGPLDGGLEIHPITAGVRSRAERVRAAVLPMMQRLAEAHGVPGAVRAAPEA